MTTSNDSAPSISENTVFTATLAGGCFWCLEAIFMDIKGISNLQSGFSGGQIPNPSYQDVCNGDTGHAEVIQFDYDPDIINYVEILKIFFTIHNPTTLNAQGNDVGPQYRSAVFYHDKHQKIVAEEIIYYLENNNIWENIVTEINPFETFYPAGSEHNNYFNNNPENRYCQLVIAPKLDKFRELFQEMLNN